VSKTEFTQYWAKAKEFFESAEECFSKNRPSSACSLTVLSMISASDTLTIKILGKKSSGQSHSEATILLKQTLPHDEELNRQIIRFEKTLGLKSSAHYGGGEVTLKDAEVALKDTRRFLDFVEKKIREG
jgi:uncharacterized protein (UPF0332 family)